MAEERVRDAAGAQSLKGEHDAIKGEIETREESFRNVVDLGEAMVQTGHYAATVKYLSIFLAKFIYPEYLFCYYFAGG